jgi:pimeloyl-ACP methyl ester carboxylesterase
MRTETIIVNTHSAPLRIWDAAHGEADVAIHFAHGNGFPAGTYSAFINQLAQNHRVYALEHRAIWSGVGVPPKNFSWSDAADDMIAAIEQCSPDGVIGVGHSLGGVMTLIAAAKRPDLFKQIILIEPMMFPTRAFAQLAWMPMWLRKRVFSLSKRTEKRRAVWDSHDDFVDSHIGKPAFKGISRTVMADYATHGLAMNTATGQLHHTFPTQWEAHIFRSPAYAWRALMRLKVPCVCLRAEESQWIPSASWRKWAKLRPDLPVTVLPKLGHMAPLQNPEAVAAEVLARL